MTTAFEPSRSVPKATWAIAQLVALVVLTGTLAGLMLIATVGGTFVAISNIAH